MTNYAQCKLKLCGARASVKEVVICQSWISHSKKSWQSDIIIIKTWTVVSRFSFVDNKWFSSVQSLSRVQLFVTPWTAARQASLSIIKSKSLLKLMSTESVMPSNHLLLCHLLLLLPSIFPSMRDFTDELALCIRWPKVLELQLQHQSFQWIFRTDLLEDGLTGSPCSPRDSQESSPTTRFKSINSLVLSFLCSPTLTSIHDYWKNHSLDQMDICWQSNASTF